MVQYGAVHRRFHKPAFHDTDTDTDFLVRVLADSPENPREDVGVGVGVVECELKALHRKAATRGNVSYASSAAPSD